MTMIIKSTMKTFARLAGLLLAVPLVARAADKPRPAPPIKPLDQYAMVEKHENEKVIVAAEPCDDTDACPFFRLPYVSHGFLAVRLIVQNDRDEALDMNEMRVQFLPAEGDREGAATDEDLNRRLFSQRQAQGTKIPLIGVTVHHEPVDKKILSDDTDFGFANATVPAHSTRAGYVFYDTRQVDEPVMKGAELLVKMIRYQDAKGAQHELFSFNLPFDKFLASQPKEEKKKDEKK